MQSVVFTKPPTGLLPLSNGFPLKCCFLRASVLAWRIPGTGEPGGLPSMGSHRVGHDWSDLAAAAETFPNLNQPCLHPSFSESPYPVSSPSSHWPYHLASCYRSSCLLPSLTPAMWTLKGGALLASLTAVCPVPGHSLHKWFLNKWSKLAELSG